MALLLLCFRSVDINIHVVDAGIWWAMIVSFSAI